MCSSSRSLWTSVLLLALCIAGGTPALATPINTAIFDHTFEDHSNDAHRNEDLSGLDFSFATFASSDLRGTDFAGSILQGVDFSGADLRGNGDFTGAFFGGANLTGIVMNGGTDLSGAFYTSTTVFSPGFDPIAEGMLLIPEPGTAALASLGLALLAARRRRGRAQPPRAAV